ncbi:MAG: translation initiation factor IF-3 [Clostridia bacterium]|nr:translation initiation factor IF-3 [Clostridia bacterium]MBQ9780731.1 translation initiation factor IF-3 [Clostridia bacterium]
MCRGFALRCNFYFWRCVPIATNAKEAQTPINEEINLPEVRVISTDGEPLGIMSSKEAQKLAYEKDMDLVLIAPQANPPVCKIMDYGKYLFEKQKREKEAKKKQQTIEVKEIQLSCRIDTHDYETKLNQAKKFLTSGNKVRVVLKFKGREMSHQAIGRELLERFQADASEVGQCEKKPVLDGRFMSMIINPLSNKSK